MSKAEVPVSLRPRWEPSNEKTAELMMKALEGADKQMLVIGFNSVVKSLANLACVVVFCDAGSLVASLPIDAYLKGIACAALSTPSPALLAWLKLRNVACIGLKREALAEDALAAAVLASRADCNVQVPFGDLSASIAALKPQVAVQAQAKPKVQKKPLQAQAKSITPVKRFFSTLD